MIELENIILPYSVLRLFCRGVGVELRNVRGGSGRQEFCIGARGASAGAVAGTIYRSSTPEMTFSSLKKNLLDSVACTFLLLQLQSSTSTLMTAQPCSSWASFSLAESPDTCQFYACSVISEA